MVNSGNSAILKAMIVFILAIMLTGTLPVVNDDDAGTDISESAESGHGSRATLDVGISGIDPLPTNPANPTDFFPGQMITINVMVTNHGSRDIALAEGNTFDVLFVVSDQSSYSHSEKQTVSALKSGSSFTLAFLWTPPPFPPQSSSWDSYPHTFMLNAYTTLENDGDSGNNAMTRGLQILEPGFDPYLDYRDGSDATLKGDVGDILYYEFTLFNKGKSPDTILLEVTELPEDWEHIPFDAAGYNLDDKDNTSDRLRLTVKVSYNKDFAMADHEYEIVLRARSLNFPLATHRITFLAEINFMPGIIITPPFEDAAFTPGTLQYLDFNITNNGNGVDSFRMMVEIPTVAKLKGWEAHIQSGSSTNPLKRGETGTTTVRLTVPAGLYKGQSCNIKLTAESRNPASKNKEGRIDEVYVLVRAGEVYGLELSYDEGEVHVRPGRSVSIPFSVENTGNVKDDTIGWAYDPPPGWICGLDQSLIPDGGLGQRNIATIEMDAFVPSAEQFGTYHIPIWVYSGEDIPQKLQDELTLTVVVDREFRVGLGTNTVRKEGEIGTVINYKLKVKNNGNSDDTYDLAASSGWVVFTPTVVSVPIGQTQTVIASVHVPLNASGDTNPISRDHRDGYRIDLTARSQNDTEVYSTCQVEALVQPHYSFEVRSPFDRQTTTSDRETVVEFDLEVENFGNIADIIDFEVLPTMTGDDWGVMRSIHRPVGLDRVEHVKFEAMPPMGTTNGVYRFDILCVSQGSEDLVRRGVLRSPLEQVVSVFVNVSSLDLALSGLSVNGVAVPLGGGLEFGKGDSLVFSVEVTNWAGYNYTNTMHGDIVVKFYVDDMEKARRSENISFLGANEATVVAFQWSAVVGRHDIAIVVDPSDTIPESDEGNNEEGCRATVYSDLEQDAGPGDPVNPFAEQGVYIILIILCVAGAVAFFWARTRVRELEEEETGYTEDGEYKPYHEAYEAFADEGDRFESEAASDPEHPYSVPGVGEVTASRLYSSSGSPYGDAGGSGAGRDVHRIDVRELALLPAAEPDGEEAEDVEPIRVTKPLKTTKPLNDGRTGIRVTKPVDARNR